MVLHTRTTCVSLDSSGGVTRSSLTDENLPPLPSLKRRDGGGRHWGWDEDVPPPFPSHDRPGGPAPPEAVARFRTAAMELLLRRPEAWLAKRVCAAAHETFGGTRQPAASTVAVAVHMGIINAPSTASASNLVG